MSGIDDVAARLLAGEPVDPGVLDDASRAGLVTALLDDARGRRWLRSWPALDARLAERLLAWQDDFSGRRRDASLERVVALAPLDALESHAISLATGPAAAAFWRRLAAEPDRLARAAELVVGVEGAAEATLYLLVLDPLDEHGLGNDRRIRVAEAALTSRSSAARGAAVEYLADAAPDSVVAALDELVRDDDERVRGIAWLTGLRVDTEGSFERAVALAIDESAPVPHRRSALVAIGMRMPTNVMAGILSAFVVHPDEHLALDAADLLFARHRNPVTAEAARLSPHPRVREIAEALLDPLRGSPAAGGSRPGDPTRTLDIFKALLERGDATGADGAPRR